MFLQFPLMKNIDDVLQRTSINSSDYLKSETIINLHPKALVACMRVDSCFNPNLVPNIQTVVNVAQIQLNLINQIDRVGKSKNPEILQNYKIIDDASPMQTFLVSNFKNIKVHSSVYSDMGVSLQTSFNFSSDVLDYTYLDMQSFVEPFSLESYLDFGSTNVINSNVITSEVKVRYGPTIGHTLAVSEQIWKQILSPEVPEKVIVTRYVVCNDTLTPIHFGQDKTDEKIQLKDKECCLYAFRSDKLEQTLQFSIQNNTAGSLQIGNDSINYLKCYTDNLLIVKNEKISTSQKKLTLKGQIEFLNMTMQSFGVSFKSSRSVHIESEDDFLVDFELGSKMNKSVLSICDATLNQSIKYVRLIEISSIF